MVWSLGPAFQRLVAEGGDLTVQGEYRAGSSGLPGRMLHLDAAGRFRLIVASFAAGKPTPVHSHVNSTTSPRLKYLTGSAVIPTPVLVYPTIDPWRHKPLA